MGGETQKSQELVIFFSNNQHLVKSNSDAGVKKYDFISLFIINSRLERISYLD